MNSLKLYATGSATANAAASVTIPGKTTLKGIQANVIVDSNTDGASLVAEVSRASAREVGVNGAQQSILEVGSYNNLATSGMANNALNNFFPVSVPVIQGQIIYLHVQIAGTLTYYATFILWY